MQKLLKHLEHLRALSNKPIRMGVYAVIIQNDKILLTKTQASSETIMNFPGGGVDMHEGFAQALERECLEELGCSVTIDKLIYSSQTLYCNPEFPDTYMFNLYFKATVRDQINYDLQESEWCSLQELP